MSRRNDESTKTRIETLIRMMSPTVQKSRNDESTKTRIETASGDMHEFIKDVVMTNPLKQGLKPRYRSVIFACGPGRNDESTKTRIETAPGVCIKEGFCVVMTNPLKQGLKQSLWTSKTVYA